MFNNSKINILWNKKVIEFIGKNDPIELNKLLLEDTKNNQKTELSVAGAFVAIGHNPSTDLFKNKIKMDNENYIISNPDSTQTSIEGVYAAGDVNYPCLAFILGFFLFIT